MIFSKLFTVIRGVFLFALVAGAVAQTAVAQGLSISESGDLTVNGKVRSVTDPVAAQDAATKNYVDAMDADKSIVESSSSAAGRWVKFGDGTLIQWGRYSGTITGYGMGAWSVVPGVSNGYYNAVIKSFPVAFIDTNYSVTVSGDIGGIFIESFRVYMNTATAFKFEVNVIGTDVGLNGNVTLGLTWIATGRWK